MNKTYDFSTFLCLGNDDDETEVNVKFQVSKGTDFAGRTRVEEPPDIEIQTCSHSISASEEETIKEDILSDLHDLTSDYRF
tara:strand:- start:600 stop:842 length:243 start_codon:yes stop_codon:yes gene_type:complete